MSGECEKCGEQVVLLFTMPIGGDLEIRSSSFVDEDIEDDEEVNGIVYNIYWDDIIFPFCIKTKLQAVGIALGCKWAAQEMRTKLNNDQD